MPRFNFRRVRGNLGVTLLAAWLILNGLAQAISLQFLLMGTILGVLAITAGVLILLDR